MARFHCPECDISRQVPEAYLGRRARCPGCGREISIVADEPDAHSGTGARATDPASLAGALRRAAGASASAAGSALFRCNFCGHERSVPGAFADRKARCPECGAVVKVLPDADLHDEPSEEDVALDDLADDLAESFAAGATDSESLETDLASDMDAPGSLPLDAPATPEESGPERRPSFVRGIAGGLALGLTAVLFSLALALLPATGTGHPEIWPLMVQMCLAGALAGSLVAALRGEVPFATAGPSGVVCAGLFLLAGRIAAPGAVADGEATATLAAAIIATALLSGLFCLLLARFRDGGWIRFVPFPVLGGVMAGTGVILLQAAYQARTGIALDFSRIVELLRFQDGVPVLWGEAWAWLPSLVFGLLLALVFHGVRRIWWMALPLLLAVGWCSLAPVNWLASAPGLTCGWSEAPTYDGLVWLHSMALLQAVDWAVFADLGCLIPSIALLLAMNVAHASLTLEERHGQEVAPALQLRTAGAANLVAGLAVGFPVSLSVGRSLGVAGGYGGRFAGLLAAFVCALALTAGAPLLSRIPAFLPAGVLVFLGLNLLRRWLVAPHLQDLRVEDYVCLLGAFAVTVGVGFAPGVVTGVVLALLLGLARHASTSALKQVLSGSALRSNVDRSPVQSAALRGLGEAIIIVRLQGYVSSGSLNAALRAMRRRLREPGVRRLRYVVLDFTATSGFGSGLLRGFGVLLRAAREADLRVILTNVPFVLEARLEKEGMADGGPGDFVMFRNLDFALEWCEDNLLDGAGLAETGERSMAEVLAPVFPDGGVLPRVMRLLQRQEFGKGEYVFRQGEESDAMYFVESGMLTVELDVSGGKTIRLKKLGPGAVFGEMGIYTGEVRSASVRGSERCVVHRLSGGRLAALRERVPEIAAALDRFLVILLSRRVADANAVVRDLMR